MNGLKYIAVISYILCLISYAESGEIGISNWIKPFQRNKRFTGSAVSFRN